MSRLTLTPGMESRLDGAPGVDFEQEEMDALAAYYVSQGMKPREAAARAEAEIDARKDAAAAREVGIADASRQRQEAWDMAGTDQRPTDVMEAEADYDRELATDIAGSYRQDGPVLRPGTPGFAARDRRMAMEGAPFTRGRSEDPIDDDVALRKEYERRFGRPPRTQEEVDFARTLMVDDFQTAGGQRKRSQAPGRWGSQQPFESQQQMDAYEASSPGQPSQLQADMYRSPGGPMVLRQYEDGGRGPAIAAPMPGIGEQYQVYNPETGGYEVRTRDGNTPLSGGTSNAAFQDSLEAPLRRTDLERPKEWGGGDNLPTLVEGPAGPEWVYRMSPEAQAEATRKRDAFLYEQRMDRLARKSGGGYDDANEAMQLPPELMPKTAEGEIDTRQLAMRQMQRAARRGYEDRKAAQVANARRIQTENAQMNSGQPGLQMQQMDPGFRQVMLLDRLTQGRRGGATPLDVQAAQAGFETRRWLNSGFNDGTEGQALAWQQQEMARKQQELAYKTTDEWVATNIASRPGSGGSAFTPEGRQRTLAWARKTFPWMPEAELIAMVDTVGATFKQPEERKSEVSEMRDPYRSLPPGTVAQ